MRVEKNRPLFRLLGNKYLLMCPGICCVNRPGFVCGLDIQNDKCAGPVRSEWPGQHHETTRKQIVDELCMFVPELLFANWLG